MGEETSYHKIGKEIAKLFLRKKGFTDKEIFEEYHFPLAQNWRRIDIVGINSKRKIAIEIGNVTCGIENIYYYFDEVYIFNDMLKLSKSPDLCDDIWNVIYYYKSLFKIYKDLNLPQDN